MLITPMLNPKLQSSEVIKKNKDTGKTELVNDITRVGTPANQTLAGYEGKTKSKSTVPSVDNKYNASIADYLTGLTSSSGGTGGYYTLDISNMLKAYEQAADTQRQVAQQTYNTKREDLLTSLKIK